MSRQVRTRHIRKCVTLGSRKAQVEASENGAAVSCEIGYEIQEQQVRRIYDIEEVFKTVSALAVVAFHKGNVKQADYFHGT